MHNLSIPPSTRIVFVGGGNMASAILQGLIKQGMPGQHLTVIEPTEASRQRLEATFGVNTVEANPSALPEPVDVVVWAVKPQVLQSVAQPLAPLVRHALHVSIAAGIGLSSLEKWLGCSRIVRCMPNTPAQIGQGMSGMVAAAGLSQSDKDLADGILAAAGERMWLASEQQLDALTAISGSGPAYVFLWMAALMQGGQELGLSSEQAKTLAAHTLIGAANLALQSEQTPDALRQAVTSKGGTTHEAITTMQQRGVPEAIVAGMHACYNRALALGKELG